MGKEPPIYGFTRLVLPILGIILVIYLIKGCLGC
jgi:hypothetical protein